MTMRGEEGLPSSGDLGFLFVVKWTAHPSSFSGSLVLLPFFGGSIDPLDVQITPFRGSGRVRDP